MRDVAAPVPLTIAASASINRAARLMRAWDVTEILVTDEGQLIGVLTATEVVVRAIAAEEPPSSITAGDACDTAHPRLVDDQPVHEALEHMRSLGLPRLPVVERQGRLVGNVWIIDLETVVAAARRPALAPPVPAAARPARPERARRSRTARPPYQPAGRPLVRAAPWPLTHDDTVRTGHSGPTTR